MSRRKVSNPLALAVLGSLSERPMHPYEIGTLLRARHKNDSIKLNYGSLYTVVESLQRHGLIVPAEAEREGRRPERTVYSLTDAGRIEFVDWLSELLSTPVKEYTHFEAGLSFLPALPPADVAARLRERARELELELVQMRSALGVFAASVPRLFWVEFEYRMVLRQAELDWTRELAGEIEEGKLEGSEMWTTWHESEDASGVVPANAHPERP